MQDFAHERNYFVCVEIGLELVEIIVPSSLGVEGWLILQNPAESSLSQTLKRMSLKYANNVFIGLERDV